MPRRPMLRRDPSAVPPGKGTGTGSQPPPFPARASLQKALHEAGAAGLRLHGRDQALLQAALQQAAQKEGQRDALAARLRSAPPGSDPGAENTYLKLCEELRLLDQAVANGHHALGPVDHPLQRRTR